MFTRSWHWFAHWTEDRLCYCSRCNKSMPCRRTLMDVAWTCQRCGHRV